jgi:hypothetical protein
MQLTAKLSIPEYPINKGDFSLYASLCYSVQGPRVSTPNAKVAGWTPARATTKTPINIGISCDAPNVSE